MRLAPPDVAGMTPAERDRYYRCTSKRAHIDPTSARSNARRTPPKHGRRARSYHCPYCQLWHVGHKNARPKPRP